MVAWFTRHVDADLSRVTREALDEWLSIGRYPDRDRSPATLTQRRVCVRPFIRGHRRRLTLPGARPNPGRVPTIRDSSPRVMLFEKGGLS